MFPIYSLRSLTSSARKFSISGSNNSSSSTGQYYHSAYRRRVSQSFPFTTTTTKFPTIKVKKPSSRRDQHENLSRVVDKKTPPSCSGSSSRWLPVVPRESAGWKRWSTPFSTGIEAASGSVRNSDYDDDDDGFQRRWKTAPSPPTIAQLNPNARQRKRRQRPLQASAMEEAVFQDYIIGALIDEALERSIMRQGQGLTSHDRLARWNYLPSSQRRQFTTKSTTHGNNDNDNDNNNDNGNNNNNNDTSVKNRGQVNIEQQHKITGTDPEFADYLNANDDISKTTIQVQTISKPALMNINDSTIDPQLETQSISTETPTNSKKTTGFEWFNTLLTDESTNLAHLDYQPNTDNTNPNKSNNSYTERDHRRNNREKTRAKRVVTVRRALIGNLFITAIKLAAFLHSGSSALKAEFVHSVVDCGNQSLLLLGLRDSGNKADRAHPYGYGKSIYFWALVSALGTFFLGAGISMTQSIPELIYGHALQEITWHVWGVLGVSFAVDGYVFTKTMLEVKESMPANSPASALFRQIYRLRDPAILAILLEDGAACLGILIAFSGLALTHALSNPVYDAAAGVAISALLAAMGIVLVRVNHRFLLGQAVDYEIVKGIEKILLDRISIDHVHSVQSQWTGPETFSYKAEVDFDGTFLAAKLMPRYQQEFAEARATLDQDLRVLLSWYAEDVMRTVEREVRDIEADIRKQYPGAQFIELEPMSKDADRYAIDDGMEAQLKRIETEALNRYLKRLYQDRPPRT